LVGFHHNNSLVFKLKDDRVFIRVDFNSYNIQYASGDANRVAVSIKSNLMNMDNLVATSPDGAYKDETLNYIIDISNIRVGFETFSGADIRLVGNTNTVRTGFASTVEVLFNLKNTDNITIESKSYKNTTKHLLMSIPYQTQNEALDAANEKGYIKKVIDKIVSMGH
ncbi:MAG: hypothetical protein JWQ30_206, partial [Sediminibacterium sp.]|nr:hypothetical protein [Sediminibacterium sp.]